MPRPSLSTLCAGAFGLVLHACFAETAAAVVARTAGDLCPATADPCVVSQELDVQDGSDLDIGLRTLRVQGAGVLDFGAGSATIRCGRLELETAGTAVRVRGSTAGGSRGGAVTVLVRGHCASAPAMPCFFDSDCNDAGSSCASGAATAMLDGAVSGNAERPGRFVLRSAGEVRVAKPLSLASLLASSDGGTVEIESTTAGIAVSAAIEATGGAAGAGGSIELLAATDLQTGARIDARGGDYDGGSITGAAGRDVLVSGEMRADATGGAGFGGDIDVAAGRDLTISGGSATNALVMSTDGHQSAENIGGDGGLQSWEAGRDLRVGAFVRFDSSGAAPDGFGDTIAFASGGATVFDGSVVSKARGALGGGGLVEVVAAGDASFGPAASFDLTGAAAGGDWIVEAEGAVRTSAEVDVSGADAGVGGRVVVAAGGEAAIGGTWRTGGAATPYSLAELAVEGCTLRIDGSLTNAGRGGRNVLVARGGIDLAAGASVVASGDGGTNELRRRSAEAPSVLAGRMLPSPVFTVDAALAPCTPCDGDADCDDGAGCTLDLCSGARCVHEPQAGVCDDGESCTADTCTTSGCEHAPIAASCDDGDFCTTTDTCSDGACVSEASPLRLDARVALQRGQDAGTDRGTIRLELDAPDGWDPAATPLRVVVARGGSLPLYDATIAASSFERQRRRWSLRPDAAPAGLARAVLRLDDGGRAGLLLRFEDAGLVGAVADAAELRVSVVFGDDPSAAPCASGVPLRCVRRDAKLRCSAPDE